MSNTIHGISYYTTGTASFAVHFPENKTICAQCPFITRRYGVRYECVITNEHLLYPEHCRGNECPITFEEVQECQK